MEFTYQAPAFTDPEGDSLTYTAALSDGNAFPSWLSFTANTRTLQRHPSQEADTPATHTIRITATRRHSLHFLSILHPLRSLNPTKSRPSHRSRTRRPTSATPSATPSRR